MAGPQSFVVNTTEEFALPGYPKGLLYSQVALLGISGLSAGIHQGGSLTLGFDERVVSLWSLLIPSGTVLQQHSHP